MNQADIERLRIELAATQGTLIAIVDAAGGKIEGHATSTINILQRIRNLRWLETTMLLSLKDELPSVNATRRLREHLDANSDLDLWGSMLVPHLPLTYAELRSFLELAESVIAATREAAIAKIEATP